MSNTIQMSTLGNGLRVITDTVPGIDSVALGTWIGVGTRHEDMIHNGVAHMVEHMMFKGTETRKALDIVQEIENIGGNMNAYTSREVTSYHMHVLKEDARIALDVLADMMQNSIMPEDEVERERQVILQEIGMCIDMPDDLVFDKYYETAYPDQAIGAPILGTTDIIKDMSRPTLMDYVCRFYTPSRMVISAAGGIKHDDFARMVEDLFNHMPNDTDQGYVEAKYQGGELRIQKNLEQSHVILGFQGLSRMDDDFYAVQALSTVLGGGMSSRLFQEVREKRGLVYSIFSFHSAYNDDGQFGIYAGTGPNDLPELMPVICSEISNIEKNISESDVEKAKTQMRAGLLMGRESMMSRAGSQAKQLLFRDKVIDIEELKTKIDAIDKTAVMRAAGRIFTGAPTLTALGPLEQLESYASIANRLGKKLAA